MWAWRRRASAAWLEEHEELLYAMARGQLVVVEKPRQRQVLTEVASAVRSDLAILRDRFRGNIERVASWSETEKVPPWLRIGNRLAIARARPPTTPPRLGKSADRRRGHDANRPPVLVIPAGAAFGTGDHATTVMSLRLLEQISRKLRPSWRLLDLGTGSGIFALAGYRFGARKIVGLDSDPLAISTAEQNAHANKIPGVKLILQDVHRFRARAAFDLICANLYSELLIQLLPAIAVMLRSRGWTILSGTLREQEDEVTTAIARAGLRTSVVRRRGKWIALAAHRQDGDRTASKGGGRCRHAESI